jgi:DNA polymerase III alpha subunit (gram-positive type)
MIEDNQIYVAVDIEADGPTPGLYSMLSIGAVATTANEEVSRFYRKLSALPEAMTDPATMEWWKTQSEAWEEVNTDVESPEIVIKDFCEWVESLGAEPVFVAHPIALDYTFVSWYLYKFAYNPFNDDKNAMRTFDLTSFIAGKYNLALNDAKRPKLPLVLTTGMLEHTHKAIDDAIGYGVLIRNALKTSSLT